MTIAVSRFCGCLLVVLGAWGALVPFIGPYIGYAYTPDKTWTLNSGRLWLSVVPGAAAFFGGLLVLLWPRMMSVAGALLAALGGVWFVIGVPVLAVAKPGIAPGKPVTTAGAMFSPAVMRLLETVGFFSGLGVVVVFFAAVALGRARLASVAGGEIASEPVDAFNPAF
jgi:hypothetical protein